jgi:hypothetical protein
LTNNWRNQHILYDPDAEFAGSPFVFQDNCDALSGPDVVALLTLQACRVSSLNRRSVG